MKGKKKILIISGIAVAVLAGILVLLLLLPKGDEDKKAEIDEGISMSTSVDENGVHQVKINLNENGEIDNNSYGTLMEYVPAKISTIHVENKSGSLDVEAETPTDKDGKTEATKYTLKGYEDFEYQDGLPDSIANSAATISFEKVASLNKDNEDAEEYGLDKPRATVTVNYTDKTKAIIYIGDNSPSGGETYLKFGSGDEIFVIEADTAKPFDYGITDLMKLTINDSASDSANSQASSITISGSAFKDDIKLEPYTGDKSSASYVITSPESGYASEIESSNIEGAIRGLYAESVKMVNPSEKQLKELGLDSPYAEVKAVYEDTKVDVLASKPDKDGKVNLMLADGKIVYVMDSANLPWVTTSYEKLMSEYVIYPKLTSLSAVEITSGGKTYKFDLNSTEKTTTDDSGNESTATETTIKYGDKEIKSEDFSGFYDAISLIEREATKESKSGSSKLTIKYTYTDGSTDTAKFYQTSDGKYVAELNDKTVGQSHKSAVESVSKKLSALLK